MPKLCKFGHPIGTELDCVACKRSRAAKKRWENPSKAMLEACDAARKLSNTNGLRSKSAQEKRDKYFSSDLHKQRARQQALKLAEERRQGTRSPCPVFFRDTKPELAVKSVLESNNLNFIQQFGVGPYSFDFCLPDQNILIEVQGEYWHSQPKNKQNDKAKFTYTQRHFPGYEIVYVQESHTLTKNGIETILNKFCIITIYLC